MLIVIRLIYKTCLSLHRDRLSDPLHSKEICLKVIHSKVVSIYIGLYICFYLISLTTKIFYYHPIRTIYFVLCAEMNVSISHTRLISHIIQEENCAFVEGQIREYGIYSLHKQSKYA